MYCDPKVDHTNYLIKLYTNRDEKEEKKLSYWKVGEKSQWSYSWTENLLKTDGVGPIDNRPSTE